MKKSCILIVLLSLSACLSAPVDESGDDIYMVPKGSYGALPLYDEYTTADVTAYDYPLVMENNFENDLSSSHLLQRSSRVGTTPHMQIARPVPALQVQTAHPVPTVEEMEPQPIVINYSSSAEGRP